MGDKVKPDKVYHKSNPIYREQINNDGLKCMKGDSYEGHSPEEKDPPAIFGYVNDINNYDTTYDDDIWLIDATKITNTWFIDNEVGKIAVVTYNDIPRSAIKLVYKGIGDSLYENKLKLLNVIKEGKLLPFGQAKYNYYKTLLDRMKYDKYPYGILASIKTQGLLATQYQIGFLEKWIQYDGKIPWSLKN